MLYEKIENQKGTLYPEDCEIPSYITDNLKFPLYEWQKNVLENFLINERTRAIKSEKRSRFAAELSYVQHGDRKRKNADYGGSDSLLLQAGLPFFNAGDKAMKEKFREQFEEIV